MIDIVEKKLEQFKPANFITKLFKRAKYMTYHLLRFNIKRYLKKNTLHKDLKSGLIFK